MSDLYRMLDIPAQSRPAILVKSREEAAHWNTPEHGYGIFATVNSFNGPRRKDNLRRINAWCVDIDAGTKVEMVAKLNASPLVPSLIVETKRGYQAYWFALDGKADHWNAIMVERLVPHFGADENARDLARILRAPGFLHLKDPSDPFMCEVRHKRRVFYSERQMADAFTWVPSKALRDEAHAAAKREHRATTNTDAGEDFWDAVYALDCRDALERLNAAGIVTEPYTFKRAGRNGNWNILVGGNSTSCWIDSGGHIGSSKKGGPTPYQWLRWFGMSPRDCVDALKKIYPHLADIDVRNRAAFVARKRAA